MDHSRPTAQESPLGGPGYREELRFPSGPGYCAAWHFPAREIPDTPCIVMAHGFGATRHYGLAAYARRFQQQGYAVLLFDYRHFGDSEGTPRGLLNVRMQLQDWTAVVDSAHTLGYRQIVLWGTSFAGGHVLQIAASRPDIAAVISQVPHISGPASAFAVPAGSLLRLGITGIVDAVLSRSGRRRFIRAFAPEGRLAAMSTPGAYDSMLRLLPDDPGGKDGMSWRAYFDRNNQVTASAVLQLLLYSPGRSVAQIRCPVLLQAGRRDRTTPFGPAYQASRAIPDCTFIDYDVDHFDVYLGDHFETTVRDQLRFLARIPGRPHAPDRLPRQDAP